MVPKVGVIRLVITIVNGSRRGTLSCSRCKDVYVEPTVDVLMVAGLQVPLMGGVWFEFSGSAGAGCCPTQSGPDLSKGRIDVRLSDHWVLSQHTVRRPE